MSLSSRSAAMSPVSVVLLTFAAAGLSMMDDGCLSRCWIKELLLCCRGRVSRGGEGRAGEGRAGQTILGAKTFLMMIVQSSQHSRSQQ